MQILQLENDSVINRCRQTVYRLVLNANEPSETPTYLLYVIVTFDKHTHNSAFSNIRENVNLRACASRGLP